MRVLLLLLVLVAGAAGGVVGYLHLQEQEDGAAAKPAAAPVSPVKADRAAVKAVLLTEDDFPPAWKTRRERAGAGPASFAKACPGGTVKSARPRAEGVSRRFAAPSGGPSAQVAVAAYPAVGDASAAMGAFMSPRDLACVVGRLVDAEPGGIRTASVDAPLVGDEAVGVRARVAGAAGGTVDVVAVRQGRTVLVFTFGAGADPWTLAERQALIDRALARVPVEKRAG
jgi:hypothetical protein